jgi:hypothetical protein
MPLLDDRHMTIIIRWIAAATALFPAGAATADNAAVAEPSRPHLLEGEISELIVRIRGGDVCTGTPITATRYVVTAAHCVLDADGTIASSRTVLRDGVTYTPRSVLVDPGYQQAPSPNADVAVLVMARTIPGPSALLGESVPAHGTLTLAGFQPIDTDGTLLRGARYGERPLPQGTRTGVIKIASSPAGCVNLATAAQRHPNAVEFPCGLIPGASGGGLFATRGGQFVLVGITSTVSLDLTTNRLAPTDTVHELLARPDSYRHEMSATASSPAANIDRK